MVAEEGFVMPLFFVALVCLGAAGVSVMRAYRRLLELDARCEAAAADIEAEFGKRRALLPALVGVVRAFEAHDRDALDALVKAHGAVQRATSPQARLFAETRLGDSVRALLARAQLSEQLRSLPEFHELQEAFDETERRLAAARRDQAAAVDAFNAALRRFPSRLFAERLRLAPRAFYDIAAERLFEGAAARA